MKRLLKNIQYAIDVFFYYLSLYYTKPILGESEPISSVIFIMAILFFIPIGSLSLALSTLLKYDVGFWWVHLLGAIPVVIFTFKYFRKNDRYQKIIDSKPMFFNNHKLSIMLTILFVLFMWIFFIIAVPYWVVEWRK